MLLNSHEVRRMMECRHNMMTSSNGNIFRVTGHLWWECTGPRFIPAQRPVTRGFDVLFDLRMNKRLSKQSWSWWFEKLTRPLWRHCNVIKNNWWLANLKLPLGIFCLQRQNLAQHFVSVQTQIYYIMYLYVWFICMELKYNTHHNLRNDDRLLHLRDWCFGCID